MSNQATSESTTLARTSGPSLDEELRRTAHLRMGDVVHQNEWKLPRIFGPTDGTARSHLAFQMYTDAVFNQDIRTIQMIVNRVDGGLPKDTEVDRYQTLFGDCMNEVLAMTDSMQLKVMPEDTVMMALCKSLFDIATADIYHEFKRDKFGNKWARKINPSTERRQARDSARRLIHERAGGRKTAVPVPPKVLDEVKTADWVPAALTP